MSRNPYSPGKLALYVLAAVALGLGASQCGAKAQEPGCSKAPDGNVFCPLQTGRQKANG